jgi:site-specific recombinase XerD
MISSLKLFTRFLWDEEEVLDENLSGYIKSLPIEPFFPNLLTISELKAIICCPRKWGKHHPWIDRRRYDFFFETLACTGLRKLEALNLKVEDMDFAERVVQIKNTKGNKSRLVPLPKDLGKRLYLWFQEREAKPTDYVFESHVKRSKRIGYHTLVDELKKRARILGINKRVYMHLLRHSFITEMIRADASAMKVARIVGHADLKTTLRYTHLVVDDLKDTIEQHPMNKKEEETENINPSYLHKDRLFS